MTSGFVLAVNELPSCSGTAGVFYIGHEARHEPAIFGISEVRARARRRGRDPTRSHISGRAQFVPSSPPPIQAHRDRNRKPPVAAVFMAFDGHAGVFDLLHEAAKVAPEHTEPISKLLPARRLFGRLQQAAELAGGLGELRHRLVAPSGGCDGGAAAAARGVKL